MSSSPLFILGLKRYGRTQEKIKFMVFLGNASPHVSESFHKTFSGKLPRQDDRVMNSETNFTTLDMVVL